MSISLPVVCVGCRDRTRTRNLWGMNPASYHNCSTLPKSGRMGPAKRCKDERKPMSKMKLEIERKAERTAVRHTKGDTEMRTAGKLSLPVPPAFYNIIIVISIRHFKA